MTPEGKQSPRILLIDIETSPLISYTWGTWEQNVIKVIREWYILCCSVKWLGKKTRILSLPQYALYKKDPHNDRELVKAIAAEIDKADILIGHNLRAFDFKKINARIFFHQLPPPSPSQLVDTLSIARSQLSLTSNKLNSIAQLLGIGQKVDTGGFELWEKVMAGDKTAWRKMERYNIQDVDLLEKVYLKLRPWAITHPSVTTEKLNCPKCGSTKTHFNGYSTSKTRTYRRVHCKNCGGWSVGPIVKT